MPIVSSSAVSSIRTKEKALLERFVGSFAKLDEMSAVTDPIAWRLSVGAPDVYGFKHWEPIRVDTRTEALEGIYTKLPARFPPLYEHLILSYRWAEVDLQLYRLLANPPGGDFTELLLEMSGDQGLWNCLLPAGYIQFGKGPDVDYDPVCFDYTARKKNGDCRIVKIDHEEILCNERVKVVAELAPTFEKLVATTIELANRQR
jgi:hypothetical protein